MISFSIKVKTYGPHHWMFAENGSNVGQASDPKPILTFHHWCPLPIGSSSQIFATALERPGSKDLCSKGATAPMLPADRRTVVQMETRSAHRRLRSNVRATRSRQTIVLLLRLYVCCWRASKAARTSSCRSARPIRVSPTRSWSNWTVGSGRTQRNASDLSERSKKVLEVAFDAVQPSTRHKSGLAMRFPRIHRIRWDKPPREADRVETLRSLIDPPSPER